MAIGRATNIFEESQPIFFIATLIGQRPLQICSKSFPGYLIIAAFLIGYYVLYALTLNDTLAFYDTLSIYTRIMKTRKIGAYVNIFFPLIMTLSSVISSSKVRQLYVELNNIDDKIKLLNVRFNYSESMRRELVHICQVMLLTILFNLTEYFPQIGPDTTRIFDLIFVVHTLPQFINSVVIANFVIVISKIRRRFEAINKLIPNLLILEKNVVSTLESEMNNLFRLRLLNRIHEKLFNAATSLNETYGLVLLTSFVVYFMASCAHLRSVTVTFGEMNNLIDFVLEILWTIFYLGKYVYVIDSCHRTTLQGKLSGRLLYERCMDADHLPLRNEAEAIARRIENRVLQLTACDFFALDYPTLKKIIVTLAAYVFFVSQFSTKSAKTT